MIRSTIPFLLNTAMGGIWAGLMGVGTCLTILQIDSGFPQIEGGLTSIPEVQRLVWIVFWTGVVGTVGGVLGFQWIEKRVEGRN